MVDVAVRGDRVTFGVRGLHRLWAFKRSIEVPRASIRDVRVDPGAVAGWKGWRLPGTHIPGLIVAGSYRAGGAWTFFDVVDRQRAVVVELEGQPYRRLVVEVEDPEAVVASLGRLD